MTPTQAPTPGPLTASDVKLLVKGDLLRVVRKCEDGPEPGSSVTFERADGNRIWINGDSDSWWFDRFTFIGRPDKSGWMPWSGGENPVPGQRVDVRFRDGTVDENGPSDDWDWPWDADQRQHDIIAFRLAPTAPVEASGSEWALQDAVDFGVGFLVDGQRVSPERVTVCHGDNSPLRPQPSGETREAVARIIDPPCWAAFDRISKTPFLDNGVAARGAHEPYLQTSLSKADAILALLSARPLALGGQQGEVECDACKRGEVRHFSTDDGFWVEITTSAGGANEHGLNGWIETLEHYPDGSTKRREYVATDSPATTPARAEAQDEGAAGYKAALIDDLRRYYNDCTPPQMEYAQSDGLAFALDTAIRLLNRAHPSPTPAADGDRVRSALTDLVTWFDKPVQGERGMVWVIRAGDQGADDAVAEALAALKSTAAKEGGEV